MIEKVNPAHPDKIADRIAGAIVDLAYKTSENARIAAEVLIGHGLCQIIAETNVSIPDSDVKQAVERIAGKNIITNYKQVKQDIHLATNQAKGVKCGDNGIFVGLYDREFQQINCDAKWLWEKYKTDGKMIEYTDELGKIITIICQSHATTDDIMSYVSKPTPYREWQVNPLGDWTGGTDVDTGATNRKLGSDLGKAVTGGGLHGKDLTKADVSATIYANVLAMKTGRRVEIVCAIGDENLTVHLIPTQEEYASAEQNNLPKPQTLFTTVPFKEAVKVAGEFIQKLGGFEKLAEWGLSVPQDKWKEFYGEGAMCDMNDYIREHGDFVFIL